MPPRTVHPFGSRGDSTPRRQAGFTLIELMVTLAVLALIGTLVLPAVAKAQSKMRTNKCVSNLQDIGTAMNLYLQDSHDKLPYASIRFNTGKKEHHLSWDDLMGPYLGVDLTLDQRSQDGASAGGSFKSLECPMDKAGIKYASDMPRTEYRRSYSMPENNMGQKAISGRKATAADWPPCPVNQTGMGLAHDGRTLQPNCRWNPDDEPGSSKVPRWQAAYQMPMILDQAQTIFMTERFSGLNHVGGVAEATVADISQHLGTDTGMTLPERVNYLMVDGHVESLAPMATYSVTNRSVTAPASGMWTVLAED
jgi:prepilin-type N-terminal cleavage/methylation domain-containing protein/prepilin-type processing-associated H-X9-DG protein